MNILAKLYVKARTATGGAMFTAGEVAKFVGGELIGDAKTSITGMSAYSFAKEGDITFALSEGDLEPSAKSKASCVVTTFETKDYPKTVIRVEDMKKIMTVLYNAMLEFAPTPKGEVHKTAIISEKSSLGKNVAVGPYAIVEEDVRIGDNTQIGANSYIGKNVTIGSSCQLFPGVTLYEETILGDNVIVHTGTVIGSDGFGYVPKGDKIYKVPQIGNVIVGNNVEIGSNTSIDRGTFAQTVIGENTKIDNLVQIAHNVRIGKNVLIAAQTGIAGSTVIGDRTMMGGNVGVADHVTVGKDVKIGAKTGVHGNVREGKTIFGYPYRDAREARKLHGLLTTLIKYSYRLRKFVRTLPEDEKEKEDA